MPADFAETNLGNLLATCREFGVGVFAIRVFAGGALAGQKPSKHTLTTKFFPLDLFPTGWEYVTVKDETYPVILTAHPIANYEEWIKKFEKNVQLFAKETLVSFKV